MRPDTSPTNAPLATEVWQRGAVPGFPPALQPIVHSLLQVCEEIEKHASMLTHDQLWARPYHVASAGFHLLHMVGATDRLFTYARGEALNADQIAYMRAEQTPLGEDVSATELVTTTQRALQRSLEQVRSTELNALYEARYIGKARLETTVIGLLFHTAEHATRHAGQLTTTAKIVLGMSETSG